MSTRRQLTLFLPPTERALVDQIREKLDPRQHAMIPAHVTLCRDDELQPWPVIQERLQTLEAFHLKMQFDTLEVLADGCLLLRPSSENEAYQALRRRIVGAAAKHHGAHITLLHPRNAAGVGYCKEEISMALTGMTITFQAVSIIEQSAGEPWVVRQSSC